MNKHVLVDITAAMEYAQKSANEYYNIGNATVNFEGLMFWMYNNNQKHPDCGHFNIPIENFIVNADEAIEMFYEASDKYVEACQENKE